MTYLFIGLIVALVVNAFLIGGLTYLHYNEKKDLYDRLMAKSIEEFKYFKEIQPVEVEHNRESLKKSREVELSDVGLSDVGLSKEDMAARDAAVRF